MCVGSPPRADELAEHDRAVSANLRAVQRWLILLFGVVTLLLAMGGYWYYRQQSHDIRNAKCNELQTIAALKIDQLVQWRKERRADARMLSTGPFLRVAVGRWVRASDDASLKTEIREALTSIGESNGYENVVLAGTDGTVLLSLKLRLTVLEATAKQLVAEAISSQGVVIGDFFRCPICEHVRLDVAAPILGADGRTVAVLILRIIPEQFLYPLIQSWPAPSQTAETLLVRKDGDDVLFLNQLRHRPDSALTLRIPLSSADVPAARAAIGATGRVEGRDYRGVDVLADMRAVPDSPWFMVAKVDTSEILAEARYRGYVVSLFVVLSILMTGVMATLVFIYRQRCLCLDLHHAERERREAQVEIRTTLYSIGDAVIATDEAARVVRMNPAAEQLTGWPEVEALHRPLEQVFRIINEQTRAEVENPAERVVREGVVVGLANHTFLIARDGSERPIADSGAPIRNEAGRIMGAVLVFRDQTEQRRAERKLRDSEQRYRSLFENMLEGLAYCQMLFEGDEPQDFVYLDVNAAFQKLTGLHDVVGRKATDVFPGIRQADPQLFEIYGRVARSGLPEKFETYREALDAWFSIAVYSTENNHFVAVFDNISERKRTEEALRESERRQAEAEKLAATGLMAARIAHEINNPLAGIKNSFRLIRDAVPKDHPDRDMVKRIEREIDRIAQVVRQMYELYSPRAQTPREIPIGEAIGDVVAMLAPLCREYEVTVEMEPVPAELRAWAPEGSLQQILYNLTVNALNASPRGGFVNICVKYVDKGFVRISIRDHGHGIPAELRDKVFEPFFSGDPTNLTKHGLGLGLSIVKSIVASVGGRIEFESAVDKGTCFQVYLPSRQP
jgi:PAS domain S-box-containing protein